MLLNVNHLSGLRLFFPLAVVFSFLCYELQLTKQMTFFHIEHSRDSQC